MNESGQNQRRRACSLFARGWSRADVARALGVSRPTSTRWYRRWREGTLLDDPKPGRRARIDEDGFEEIHRALHLDPDREGFQPGPWSLAAVAALIERRTGVRYHPRHVGRLLRRTGWVVPPVGRCAELAFRQIPHWDVDGNTLFLRDNGRAHWVHDESGDSP